LPSFAFENDIRQEILKALPFDKSDQALAAEISATSTHDLLTRFYNWLDRLVHPHPRETFLSREYIFRQLPAKAQVQLQLLQEKIERGDHLGPHLSRGIRFGLEKATPTSSKKNLNKKRDLDLLLNDWGIHHLHLSDIAEQDGFVERGDLVLFAIFRQKEVALLDVLPHGAWTDDNLVAIAVRNWPAANLFVPLKGIISSTHTFSAADRKQLRGAGISTFISVDGKTYSPPHGGISTAGTSSSMKVFRFRKQLRVIEKDLAEGRELIRKNFEEAGRALPDDPDFRIAFVHTDEDWFFVLKEALTGHAFKVG